jgi:vacuolar-type H+-ATPase subunit F/Vma7
MKKLLVTLLMVGFGLSTYAQTDAITKFFSKYENSEDFTRIFVSQRMFSMFANLEMETPEDKEIVEMIHKITGLKMLVREKKDGRTLYQEVFSTLPKNQFEELMTIRDKDNDMRFMVKEVNGKINELLMISGSPDSFMILSLTGEIDLNKVSKLGSKMNVKGLEKLEKMEEKPQPKKKTN